MHTLVGHLIDGERGLSIQIHKIRKDEETLPAGFDLTQWNAGVKQRIGSPTPAELLAGLEATRARTLQGLHSLAEDDWERSGIRSTPSALQLQVRSQEYSSSQ